jgi:2'-5' RNA ligase
LILLPASVEHALRDWTRRTPGATLPAWGAHVTLLNDFVAVHGLESIEDRIAAVCARFGPFTVRLDRVVSRTHWQRPHLKTVLLTSDPHSKDHRTLLRLRRELAQVVEPAARTAKPAVSRRRFRPHLTLTWGLAGGQAAFLAQAARRTQLKVEFRVEKIWLLQFTPSSSGAPKVKRVKSFRLA